MDQNVELLEDIRSMQKELQNIRCILEYKFVEDKRMVYDADGKIIRGKDGMAVTVPYNPGERLEDLRKAYCKDGQH